MADSPGSKLVVAVTADALFELPEREGGSCGPLLPGAAFSLVRRLLAVNRSFDEHRGPVEVVLLTRHDPNCGLRILTSVAAHGLSIRRTVFVGGRRPYRYARATQSSLFLSTSLADVRDALAAGVPAGHVRPTSFRDDESDDELRIAFDFDGVLADDASEEVFQKSGLEAFQHQEGERSAEPLDAGPLAKFCQQLSRVQEAVASRSAASCRGPLIRTAIVSSRGAPADARVGTTLRSWGVAVDEAFFLGGQSKSPVLADLKPHIFFDDQLQHIEDVGDVSPCVHVPFGVTNGPEAARSATWLQ